MYYHPCTPKYTVTYSIFAAPPTKPSLLTTLPPSAGNGGALHTLRHVELEETELRLRVIISADVDILLFLALNSLGEAS